MAISIDRSKKQKGKLVAALLTIRGSKQRSDEKDIAAAVILANFYLAHGNSPARALSEGYKVLRQAGPAVRSLPLAHGSSGR